MKEIPLTRGKVALVDDEDYDELSQHKWHVVISPSTKYKRAFYAARYVGVREHPIGKRHFVQMHRVLMNPSPKLQVDHINGNGLDNQRSNLRVVTCRQNLQNRHHPKTSKYVGVYFYRNKFWRAQVRIDGVLKDLGCYHSEDDAHAAYVNALQDGGLPCA